MPATDRPQTLDRCVEAIRRAILPPEELIVVDRPPGGNASIARNHGAAEATGDVLVFVDADVVVRPDAFVLIREAFERDPDLTAVFGSYDDAPGAPGAVSGFRNLLHHHVHQTSGGPANTFWSGLGAVRGERFRAVEGFDERVRWLEDVELGLRLVDRGGRIRLDPRIQGTHLKSWSIAEMIRTDFARRGVPWVVLLLGRGASSTALNLNWRHRVTAVACVAGVAAALARRPAPALASSVLVIGLNRHFYLLLLRRRGPIEATAGVGLHVLHHLVGAASAPAGFVLHLARLRTWPNRPR